MEAKLAAGSWDGYPGGDAPGFSFETLDWIHRRQIAAIAADTWGCEVRRTRPSRASTSPGTGSRSDHGLTMGEIFYLATSPGTARRTASTSSCLSRRRFPLPAPWARRPIRWRSNESQRGADPGGDARRLRLSHVFMVPAVLRRTFAEMEPPHLHPPHHTHGEKAAAYMADGYARASGSPACAWRRSSAR